MDQPTSFGGWLKQRRRVLDLTQGELAQRVGCAMMTIQKIEADQRRPSKQVAERLATALELPPDEHDAFIKVSRSELSLHRIRVPVPRAASAPLPRDRNDTLPDAVRNTPQLSGFELREQLGAGRDSLIYRAFQPLAGRDVAIKVVLPAHANQPAFVRRFDVEAQLVARLEHPHIVPLYDYWRDLTGAYLVMRWMRGGSMQTVLEHGPLSPAATLRMLEQIGPALLVAHRHGVVHGEVRPAHILLDEDGNAYLADFGIANVLPSPDVVDHPVSAERLATLTYRAPEQLRGEPVTPRSDIYSLGVLLYVLLAGAAPFGVSPSGAAIVPPQQEPLPALASWRSDLPAALDRVLHQATAVDPAQRYADVAGLLVDLRAVLGAGDRTPSITVLESLLLRDDVWADSDSQGLASTTPALGELPATVVPMANPYKGLRAFQEADSADFFGREELTARLLAQLAQPGPFQRFVAVVGPSGSGKSSVVRAGLLPALRAGALPGSEQWFIAEAFPGTHPLEELEAALMRVAVHPLPTLLEVLQENERGLARAVKRVLPAGPETELVLVIDQFEELWTLVPDEPTRLHVLRSLLAAVTDARSRLWIVLALRADFFDRPLSYPAFGELVQARTALVLPLTPDELQRAIVGPAQRVGLVVQPAVIAAIERDVGEQPGTLPLVQYALTELFERRAGSELTLEAYQHSGGIRGTIARQADELYTNLDAAGQTATRQLFLRLVTLGDGVEDTRRRVRRTELLSLSPDSRVLEGVIEAYGKQRLLTFDRDPVTRGPTVEVAHEALIRAWSRLQQWIDASREDLRRHRTLAAAALEWEHSGRERSFLLTGARLGETVVWAAESSVVLNAEEQAFLDTSLHERSAQRAGEQARQARERGLARRARRALWVLVAFLLLATVGALALTKIARENAVAAEQRSAEAQSLALASAAQLALHDGKTEHAVALAVAANRMDQPPALAQRSLFEAANTPGTRRVFQGHAKGVRSVSVSADGRLAASGSEDVAPIVWDVATGTILHRFEGHASAAQTVALSPDGRVLLSGADDGEILVWDVATAAVVRRLQGHTAAVSALFFQRDGRTALSGSGDGLVLLWDVPTGTIVRRLRGHADWVTGVALSPDGRTAVSGSLDSTLIVWEIATGRMLRRLVGDNGIMDVALSPDGRYVLSGSMQTQRGDGSVDFPMLLWDSTTGERVRAFSGHTASVWSVAFSPDGQRALSGSFDTTLMLWEVATGTLLHQYQGHARAVNDVAFSADGQTAISASNDHTLRLWDLNDRIEARRFAHAGQAVGSVVFSPDGTLALTRAGPANGSSDTPEDTAVTLWDVASGTVLRRFTGQTHAVRSIAFSPDGQRVLAGALDGTLMSWDVATGTDRRRFRAAQSTPPAAVWSIAYSPDGQTVVSSGGYVGENGLITGGEVIVWDTATGHERRRFSGFTNGINTAVFTTDGAHILLGLGSYALPEKVALDSRILLIDTETGSVTHELVGHTDYVVSIAVSPDGRSALSSSFDGSIRRWDLTTGQERSRFIGHESRVTSVAFSPDGHSALSGSFDGSVAVWDVASGAQLRRFVVDAPVNSIAFSPDGQYVLSGADDGKVQVWRLALDLHALRHWTTANRYVRDLSCTERTLYDVVPQCSP